MSHRKHDYSTVSWHCVECGTYAGDVIASSFPCRPSTDDSEDMALNRICDERAAEDTVAVSLDTLDVVSGVDYSAITRGAAGC